MLDLLLLWFDVSLVAVVVVVVVIVLVVVFVVVFVVCFVFVGQLHWCYLNYYGCHH